MAKIWYLGHSCFQIELNGTKVVTDPFITDNPLAKDINLSDINADVILVSHGHGDHIGDLVALAKQTGAEVVSNYEITTWLEKQGHANNRPMNHGGTYITRGIKVKMVNAVHSSSFPDGTYAGNPAGFVLSHGDEHIYFAGDTALTYDMKLIGEEFDISTAILPIGDNFTMGYKDAVKCAQFIGTKQVIGMHFDTFGYIEIDHDAAQDAFQRAGIKLELLPVGAKQHI